MNAGDTLIVAIPGTSLDSHLWIVISDPEADPAHVVIVNMTSWRSDKDQACVLDVGDHPYVSKKTCVNYSDAKIHPSDDLARLLTCGKIQSHAACSASLLSRIRNSIADSRMKMGVVELLVSQGVIEDS